MHNNLLVASIHTINRFFPGAGCRSQCGVYVINILGNYIYPKNRCFQVLIFHSFAL